MGDRCNKKFEWYGSIVISTAVPARTGGEKSFKLGFNNSVEKISPFRCATVEMTIFFLGFFQWVA